MYRNHLSEYLADISSGKWKPAELITADEQTGEIFEEKPLYVFKPENLGSMMNIDDKQIGRDGFTILSNTQTGKIAMMLESARCEDVRGSLELFGDDSHLVKSVSCDMSPTYLKACRTKLPEAQVVVDMFHVIQYVYDAVGGSTLAHQKGVIRRPFQKQT